MAEKLLGTNVKPASVRVLLLGLALLILINIAARIGLFDLTSSTSNIFTIIGSFFLLNEIAFMSVFKRRGRKKFGFLDWLIAIVAIVALLSAVLALVSINIAFLAPFQTFVELGLLIFIVIEIFRKN